MKTTLVRPFWLIYCLMFCLMTPLQPSFGAEPEATDEMAQLVQRREQLTPLQAKLRGEVLVLAGILAESYKGQPKNEEQIYVLKSLMGEKLAALTQVEQELFSIQAEELSIQLRKGVAGAKGQLQRSAQEGQRIWQEFESQLNDASEEASTHLHELRKQADQEWARNIEKLRQSRDALSKIWQ